MPRTIHGHQVRTCRHRDGEGLWDVLCDGHYIGMLVLDRAGVYHGVRHKGHNFRCDNADEALLMLVEAMEGIA